MLRHSPDWEDAKTGSGSAMSFRHHFDVERTIIIMNAVRTCDPTYLFHNKYFF